ncbi:Usher syndrome type-1G [Nymphon striatum]|nr:Usher syndrome type-1G [Nymphon striatum]
MRKVRFKAMKSLRKSHRGDPDKCDYFGNTALHCAAANGQINCVSFLVNFGANLWALDNDFHTPKDLAAMNERGEILKYLDEVIARQSALNKKVVASLKQKAILDAEKRAKSLQKMQKKTAKKADKEDKKLMKQTQKCLQVGGSSGSSSVVGTLKKDSRNGSYTSHKYSEIVNNGSVKKGPLTGVSKKVHQKKQEMTNGNSVNGDFKVRETEGFGKISVRSLSGLRRDSEVMYVPKHDSQSNGSCASSQGSSERRRLQDVFRTTTNDISRATSEPDFLYNAGTDSGIGEDAVHEPGSMFERPGFGSVAFRNSISGALITVPVRTDDEDDRDSAQASDPRSGGSANDSIGSAGSLARRNRRLVAWDDEDQGLEVDDCDADLSSIELFLVSHNLSEFVTMFVREKIDLESMLLLTDNDLKDLGMPMGPRKKMSKAIAERKLTIDEPGEVYDSKL